MLTRRLSRKLWKQMQPLARAASRSNYVRLGRTRSEGRQSDCFFGRGGQAIQANSPAISRIRGAQEEHPMNGAARSGIFPSDSPTDIQSKESPANGQWQ